MERGSKERSSERALRGVLKGRSLSEEFDPGSERTLAACLTHASRAGKGLSGPE